MSNVISESPLWLQNVRYPARLDRVAFEAMWTEGIVTGLAVAPRAAGANYSVDVGAGIAVIKGDDQSSQGNYVQRLPATLNVVVAPPDSNPRIDLVVMRVQDSQGGGPAGDNGVIVVVKGTPAASNPAVPALPATAVELARISMGSTSPSVAAGQIDMSKRVDAQSRANGIQAVQAAGSFQAARIRAGRITATTNAGGNAAVPMTPPIAGTVLAFNINVGDNTAVFVAPLTGSLVVGSSQVTLGVYVPSGGIHANAAVPLSYVMVEAVP